MKTFGRLIGHEGIWWIRPGSNESIRAECIDMGQITGNKRGSSFMD